MDDYIEEFINYLTVERGLANNTLLAYRQDLNKYAVFLSKKGIKSASHVKRDHITDFMYDQKKKSL